MTQSYRRIFTLVDAALRPAPASDPVYLWNGYGNSDGQLSILDYCDEHAKRLRDKYCSWVHDLGHAVIGGRRIIEHLAVEDGFSYWWMTLLAEKSGGKSPAIKDAIRLLALEEMVALQKPEKLKLVSSNRNLHAALSIFCRNIGIAYEWDRLPNQPPLKFSLRGIFQELPHPVRALVALARQVKTCRPLKRTEKSNWYDGAKALFFCDYFDNVDPRAASRGEFHSYYWGNLSRVLSRAGRQGNWLHLFVRCAAVPSPRAAADLIQRFSQQRQTQGFHALVEAYLSWSVVSCVLQRWMKMTLISLRLRKIQHAFYPSGSQVSLWPIMQKDWHASTRGSVAIINILWVELFNAVLREVPYQGTGLYLCENQAWERALIHAWRKHGHGKLIAVPHSTRSFWDLRFFHDVRTIRGGSPYPLPQPDLTAVNGKVALEASLDTNCPKDVLVECEALRYAYLSELPARRTRPETGHDRKIKVLILGDYLPMVTIKMLQLVEAAMAHMSGPVAYTVKPHPNYMVKPADFPSLHLELVVNPLGEILHDYNIAFSSNLSSAAVDAYLAGVPVAVMLDDMELNLSPLRGQPNVRFVSSPEELAMAVQEAHHDTVGRSDANNFFFLDQELPRWSRLLAN